MTCCMLPAAVFFAELAGFLLQFRHKSIQQTGFSDTGIACKDGNASHEDALQCFNPLACQCTYAADGKTAVFERSKEFLTIVQIRLVHT